MFKLRILTVLMLAFALVWGCASKQRQPSSALDTPLHHYQQGIKYVDTNQVALAAEEFNLALQLDDDYGPALAGLGLVQVMQGQEDGRKLIARGVRKAKGKQEKIWTLNVDIRSCAELGRQNIFSPSEMLRKAKEAFSKAKLINSKAGSPYYYMGEVYIQALDFKAAEEMFAKVKELGNGPVELADSKWQLVQKANRAAPQTSIGKKIVLIDKLSRADMAALLAEELDIDKLFKNIHSAGFVEPGQKEAGAARASDIAGHPLQGDIIKVIGHEIRGLQPYPDGSFAPQKAMSRAEVAQVFADVIIKATGNTGLATAFIGQPSPFPDVAAENYAFNAIMLCTTRGLMQTDLKHSSFEPQGSISGVDALLGLKKIKEQLRVF